MFASGLSLECMRINGGAIVIGKTRKPVGGVRATLLSSDAAICPASGNTAGIAFGVRRWLLKDLYFEIWGGQSFAGRLFYGVKVT